ncbi:MAG: hypothetical protein WBH63_06605, partial [Bacillota bacterium]
YGNGMRKHLIITAISTTAHVCSREGSTRECKAVLDQPWVSLWWANCGQDGNLTGKDGRTTCISTAPHVHSRERSKWQHQISHG